MHDYACTFPAWQWFCSILCLLKSRSRRELEATCRARAARFLAGTKHISGRSELAEAAIDAIGEIVMPRCLEVLEMGLSAVGVEAGRQMLASILAKPDVQSADNPDGRLNLYHQFCKDTKTDMERNAHV
jgi:hypothetical protein